MRLRCRLVKLVAGALLATLAPKTVVAQAAYTFVKIADDSGGIGSCVAVNSSGTVVFQRTTGANWVGDGNVLTQIPWPEAPGGGALNCPGINDAGDVSFGYGFNGSGNTPYHIALLKYSGGVHTQLASAIPLYPSLTPGWIANHALTNDGSSLWGGQDGRFYVVPAMVAIYDPLPGASLQNV